MVFGFLRCWYTNKHTIKNHRFTYNTLEQYRQQTQKKPLDFRGLYAAMDFYGLLNGTRGRIRTDKPSQAADFESAVYTVPPLWRGFEQYFKTHDAVKSKAGLYLFR
jgi:hypothetical protein